MEPGEAARAGTGECLRAAKRNGSGPRQSRFLPLTHGLVAIRDALAGRLGAAAWQALAEAGVGVGWLTACLLTFGWFIRRGRRAGSLEYAT